MSWGQEPPESSGHDGAQDPTPGWGQDPPPPPAYAGDQGTAPQPGWGDDPAPNRLRPLNLGDVLDGTFRLGIAHWRAFAIGLGVIVVPLTLLSSLVTALVVGTTPAFSEIINDPEVAEGFLEGRAGAEFSDIAAASGTLLLAGVVTLLLTPLIYGVAVHIAAVGYRAGEIDPMTSVRAAAQRYLPLLGTTILAGLVPLVIFLTPLLLIIVGGVTGADALVIVGSIGFLVSLVLAVIAAIRLAVAIPALIIERRGPIEALRRSNELVKGKTGLTFGTLLVVGIIVTIIGLVLMWPFGVAAGAVGGTPGAVIDAVGQIINSLVQNALLGATLVLIYFDRRVRTEGYDLTELAGELGERRDRPW